jgi:hypothetical protein
MQTLFMLKVETNLIAEHHNLSIQKALHTHAYKIWGDNS